ncbi:MAG: AbrB/MazE/SpoVT family DNA-binding domain-containing protein [Pyrinomonadaceae bacterium]
MKAQIIQIGNSQGIRIPKTLLEDSGVAGDVELELHPDGILIRNISTPRGNWDKIFSSLAETDEDIAIDTPASTTFEKKEWQW